MKVTVIWKKFLVENQKVVRSSEIRNLAKALGKNEWDAINYLQRHGYIVRILRGIFYVKSPDERIRDYFEKSNFELIAVAMKLKNIKNWYFGLETAIKLNNMTHEYFDIGFIITDSYRTTKVIRIMNANFKFFKRSKCFFHSGIIHRNGLNYSDPEKTVLDLAYNGYIKKIDNKQLKAIIKEYKNKLDEDRLVQYLDDYPEGFRDELEGLL